MRSFTKKNLLVAACYTGVLILGMFLGPRFTKENGNSLNGSFLPFFGGGRFEKVDNLLKIIDAKYVDPVKIDTLQKLAIDEILQKLDPHSAYLPPAEAQYLEDDLEGHFNGIGIEYSMVEDTLLVTSVINHSPAYKAGLRPGNQILEINKKNIAGKGMRPDKIIELIRGEEGTWVQLLVKSQMDKKHKLIPVERGQINTSSVDAAYMITSKTGYIKISKFGAQTDEDFVASLKRLRQVGMSNLILDLRANGGGYLNSATKLADEFLEEKKLIVYTQGLHEPRIDYFATDEGSFEKGRLVVLIDEKTASASEIVAGAIQDLDRGVVIGRRSFGKGLVQEQFDFGDGSVLNLTIARYYTPSGRSIQRSYKNGVEAYYREANERYVNAAIKPDEKRLEDSLYNKDNVYKTSKGRLMYGGGGITPDIYVAPDTSGFTNFFYQVSTKGLLESFLFTHLIKSSAPVSGDDFLAKFNLNGIQYKTFVDIALSKGIKANEREIELAQPLISKELKALLGRYYYGNEMFYRVLNASDKTLSRSLEVLK